MPVIRMMPVTLFALASLGILSGTGARADALPPVVGELPKSVSAQIGEIQSKAAYAHTSWGIRVVDLDTGAVLADQAGERSMVPGSIMKVYTSATALDLYGADYRFQTPVYRTGPVSDGVLDGDLILVASGDFSFGLRTQPDGTLGYNNMPEIDHNYADTGFAGGALVKEATRWRRWTAWLGKFVAPASRRSRATSSSMRAFSKPIATPPMGSLHRSGSTKTSSTS